MGLRTSVNTRPLDATCDQTYLDRDVVDEYAALSHLQQAERAILDIVRDRLPGMTMLDVGVGGGRTTLHFAPLVRHYVGIDLSDAMVAACRRRFADALSNARFEQADIRNLHAFADGTFDFVLFSFNGLDSVPGRDRLRALEEIRRVGKAGALFCFSSHNLQSLPDHFKLRNTVSLHPLRILPTLRRWRRLRQANPGLRTRLREPHGMFFDGVHDLRLQQYYIRPAAQLQQLEGRFETVATFLRSGGQRVKDEHTLNTTRDAWIYYLCTMK